MPINTEEQDCHMFARLSMTEPRLREHLQGLLDQQVAVLVVNPNEPQLRVAQGKAQAYKQLIQRLDDARK